MQTTETLIEQYLIKQQASFYLFNHNPFKD